MIFLQWGKLILWGQSSYVGTEIKSIWHICLEKWSNDKTSNIRGRGSLWDTMSQVIIAQVHKAASWKLSWLKDYIRKFYAKFGCCIQNRFKSVTPQIFQYLRFESDFWPKLCKISSFCTIKPCQSLYSIVKYSKGYPSNQNWSNNIIYKELSVIYSMIWWYPYFRFFGPWQKC